MKKINRRCILVLQFSIQAKYNNQRENLNWICVVLLFQPYNRIKICLVDINNLYAIDFVLYFERRDLKQCHWH